MWKKALLLLSLFVFTVVVTVPAGNADARPRSFSSGKKSFSQTPAKSDSGISKSSTTNKSSSTSGTTANRGFFGGGSFMKGMMIGGLAGLMFGGMFGSGIFGNMMGFLLNAVALIVLFMIARGIYDAFRRRRQSNPNQRRW
ncbi:hypothetical protein [Cohnella lupini]|uniref:Preprotein translocase subunit Tim44 n=1 Tax=Cohnella lupini TaxID=1294267 RepID=A0A3D9IEX6_9BACL|nr:hypothetical protein [Cohnella lupini]RED60332.1 hypothetical protein DFP95_106121 [Cohnella lupini]